MRNPPVSPPLVAVAHGSRDPRAAAVVTELIDRVRAARPGLDARAAYLDHTAPSVADVLGTHAARGDRPVVLPLLLTAAYHSKIDLPGVLDRVHAGHPGFAYRYGDPLGPHPALLTALERRLADAGIVRPDPDTAVVLTAAGSSDPAANATVEGLAAHWAADARQRGPGWHSVVPAYASAAAPDTGRAVAGRRAAGARRTVVACYFLAPGLFADRVRDAAHTAGAHAVSPVLGACPELVDVVLARYDAARRLGERCASVEGGGVDRAGERVGQLDLLPERNLDVPPVHTTRRLGEQRHEPFTTIDEQIGGHISDRVTPELLHPIGLRIMR